MCTCMRIHTCMHAAVCVPACRPRVCPRTCARVRVPAYVCRRTCAGVRVPAYVCRRVCLPVGVAPAACQAALTLHPFWRPPDLTVVTTPHMGRATRRLALTLTLPLRHACVLSVNHKSNVRMRVSKVARCVANIPLTPAAAASIDGSDLYLSTR